jgi:tRNA (mo5U34)-methyltransferase
MTQLIDYQAFLETLQQLGEDQPAFLQWAEQLPEQISRGLNEKRYGDLPRWKTALQALPDWPVEHVLLDQSAVSVQTDKPLDTAQREDLKTALQGLHPWRKGPFDFFGVAIDTEWRSDWKWDRIIPHIASLKDRSILDVGCGNGYHCWRMLGAGAKMVIGIDPGLSYFIQFQAIGRLHGESEVFVLPFALEDLPRQLNLFDSVFSMGVLYHRRSPFDHLMQLKDCLRLGGELILETLIIEGSKNQVMVPEGRYAQMRNVWFIPSCDTLQSWLTRCGFTNIRLIDVSKTTTEEQRSTGWMQSQSLQDFLQADNPDLTVEGLPAPVRGIFLANKT